MNNALTARCVMCSLKCVPNIEVLKFCCKTVRVHLVVLTLPPRLQVAQNITSQVAANRMDKQSINTEAKEQKCAILQRFS